MSKVDSTRSVVIEREMPHSPEKIWRALTQGELIKEWLMDNDFQPSVGHSFNFRATPMPHWNGIIESEVLVVEPNKKLSYTWNSMGLESIVVFTLVKTAGGTIVRMEQSGFQADQDAAYNGANYGWQKFMDGLDRVVGGLG
jgi:uncharacterized protein YndB with AHSA1/START domain